MYHIRTPTHFFVSIPCINTHIDVIITNIVFEKEHVNFYFEQIIGFAFHLLDLINHFYVLL